MDREEQSSNRGEWIEESDGGVRLLRQRALGACDAHQPISCIHQSRQLPDVCRGSAEAEIHHVSIEHPWTHVSTALSPVSEGTWGALNYDILVDSPIEIGDHYVATYQQHGARHDIAITGVGNFDPEWLSRTDKDDNRSRSGVVGKLPYDRYLFIIQLLPGQYGGLEHARSSVNMFDPTTFNEKGEEPSSCCRFSATSISISGTSSASARSSWGHSITRPKTTRLDALAGRGVTSYYDDLMTYRCGFFTRDEYLKALATSHHKALDVPGRRALSLKDSSYLAWVKLYIPTADSTNRWPSYYLKKGALSSCCST